MAWNAACLVFSLKAFVGNCAETLQVHISEYFMESCTDAVKDGLLTARKGRHYVIPPSSNENSSETYGVAGIPWSKEGLDYVRRCKNQRWSVT